MDITEETRNLYQRWFDFALNGMRSQGKSCGRPTREDRFVCMYSDDSGKNHCAVGWIMVEEKWPEELLTYQGAVITMIAEERELIPGHARPHIDFLTQLQTCHDTPAEHQFYEGSGDSKFLARFEQKMKRLADNWSLDYAPPTQE